MKPLEPLSDELREILDGARWPDAPADLEERLLPGLKAAWHAEASGGAPAGSAPLSGAQQWFGSIGVWSTAGALVLGAVGGVVIGQRLPREPEVVMVPVQAPAPVVVEPVAPVAVDPVTQPVEVAPPKPVRKPTVVEAPVSTLAAEQRLVETARTALLRGQPELAMPALATYARQYPRGQLREEHDALEIQGLCLLGRADAAQKAAAQFAAKYPDSFFREAVEASLKSLAEKKREPSDEENASPQYPP